MSDRTYVIAVPTSAYDWTGGGAFEVGVPEISGRPAVVAARKRWTPANRAASGLVSDMEETMVDNDPVDLAGKVIVVTGGVQGLGEATARLAASRGRGRGRRRPGPGEG